MPNSNLKAPSKPDFEALDTVDELLYVKMHSYVLDKPDSALYFHKIISQKHLKEGDTIAYLMNEYATKANILLRMNKNGMAIIQLQKYLQLVSKWGLNVEPFAYVELGNIYFKLRLFSIADEYYRKAIETHSNPIWVYPVCLSNLGLISRENKNYKEANDYFIRSYSYRMRIKLDTIGGVYCLGLLAETANQQKKTSLAKEYLALGFNLLNKPCCNESININQYIQQAPDLFLNLLRAYRIEGKFKSMDSIWNQVRVLFNGLPVSHLAISFQLSAAKEFLEINNWRRSKECLNEYQKFPKNYRTLADERDYAWIQTKINQLEGRINEGMAWEITYSKLKDSLEAQAGTNDVIAFTSSILESQNELVKEKQQEEIKVQEQKVIQERKSRQLLTLFLIFLALVALVIFIFYKRSEADKGLISKQNQEKELLLKEIHHRVKNNLAIVSGILDMQERKLNNPEFQDIFRDAKNRMGSIATVHQTLYEQEDFGKIDAGVYLQQLCKSVYDSYKKDVCEIDIKISGNGIFIQPDVLVPLALVVNEMLTNSFKYAFKEKSNGKIKIQLQLKSKQEIEFTFSDNGPGLPETEIGSKRKSLGTMLIQGLSKQIGAELKQFNSTAGLRYSLQFKIE